MGTMGLPLSVLRNKPEVVCTSNIGLRLLKNAGLPQPVSKELASTPFVCFYWV